MHWLLLIAALAQQPTLSSGDIEGRPYRLIEIRVESAPPPGFQIIGQEWLVLDDKVDWRQYDNGQTFVATAPPGTYQARWRGQYLKLEPLEGRSEWRVYTITIRGPPGPTPVPPDPVPEPTPVPTSAPFPSPGLAVIIIREASEMGQLTAEQRAVFTSPEVLRFSQECVTIPGGTDRFFRVWDDDYTDIDLINAPNSLKIAYRLVLNQSNGRLPWIAISTGTGGHSGPLPGNVQDTLTLMRKFK